ncbi:MAG: 2Fe-2S iron-sulfur cluster-binding protein [Hyphomicrobiaceae bacterium]
MSEPQRPQSQRPDPQRQGSFRPLRVIDKVRESRIITSFHLRPVDPATWRPFEAGQFLVLRVPPQQPGQRPVPRSYSVSSSPAREGHYRITIKREAAPSPDVPQGIGSCWLHDRINIGDLIEAAGPRGEFHLDGQSPRPVVLLSGGVGLTPLVSMLHALKSAPHRPVHFIHACDNGEVHALRDEVLYVAGSRPGVQVHFCYRFPTDADRASRWHHSEGVITADLLARLLPVADLDYYMCGPPPFMKAVYGLLRQAGVPKARIAYEFFGPATVLEEDVERSIATVVPRVVLPPLVEPPTRVLPSAQERPSPAPVAPITVTFQRAGRSATWSVEQHSLLDFAEAQGFSPDFSCRSGVCGTCKTRLIAGAVEYFTEPLDPVEPGHALICCARPKGPVILDL